MLKRWIGTLVAAAVVVVAGVAMTPPPAEAANGADFDPGYIISDQVFYNAGAMDEAAVQAFLNARVPVCGAAAWNPPCLKNFTMTTQSRPGVTDRCNGYTGGTNESAARIIVKVAQACGVNPQVILVLLEKEQSLVSSNEPLAWSYTAATGYMCPDSTGCDPDFAGFFNQVWYAALQFKRYKANPYGWNYVHGEAPFIQYNPNPGCGGTTVLLRSQATAGLYNYTPYQPNAAALANLYSYGDGCSSYGNRNFWRIFSDWFGSPTDVIPDVAVARIGGENRFETAAMLSQSAFGPGVPVAYVSFGRNFPDALSAAPAAIVGDGPVLLVEQDSVPGWVASELDRLNPARIVVTGGPESVTDAVVTSLSAYAPLVTRIGGADRYETSRLIVDDAFTSSQLAYVVTGNNFPDALSAAAAAGVRGAPVVLVDGLAGGIDQPTATLLTSLGVTTVIIAGSTGVVSAGIEASIDALPGVSVTRQGGVDRFDTAHKVNRDAFASAGVVYLAAAYNFPDALAGAAVAGYRGAPLYLANEQCVMRTTAQDIIDLGVDNVVILSRSVLGAGVEQFKNC